MTHTCDANTGEWESRDRTIATRSRGQPGPHSDDCLQKNRGKKKERGREKGIRERHYKEMRHGSRWAPKGRLGVGSHPEESSFSLGSNEAPQKSLEYM